MMNGMPYGNDALGPRPRPMAPGAGHGGMLPPGMPMPNPGGMPHGPMNGPGMPMPRPQPQQGGGGPYQMYGAGLPPGVSVPQRPQMSQGSGALLRALQSKFGGVMPPGPQLGGQQGMMR